MKNAKMVAADKIERIPSVCSERLVSGAIANFLMGAIIL
jgi:hypothetical protein